MKRLHRLRQNSFIRDFCAQNEFNTRQLIQPLFVVEGLSGREEIKGLRGNYRLGREALLKQIEADLKAEVRHFILFPVPLERKAKNFSHDFSTVVIQEIKKHFGKEFFLWVDTCLCACTEQGHCCVFNEKMQIDLAATLKELSYAALSFVQAGADGISPSDMMDGRVAAIRKTLDEKGFEMTPIMSYSSKFASHFYGPFRSAVKSTPQFGDRTNYQIDVRHRDDALAASRRCADEGADLLMVKPGMTSIDLIAPIHEQTGLAVGAYQVSGEFAALHFLAEEGLIDFEKALLETWRVFKRAGAQYIITYGARLAKNLGVSS
jgi:porphobilinogen synthase